MAMDDKELKKIADSLHETARAQQAVNRGLHDAYKGITAFEKALDDASNGAIDDTVKSLKALIKNSGALTDAQLDQVKTARQAKDQLANLVKRQIALEEAQADYTKAIKDAEDAQLDATKLALKKANEDKKLANTMKKLGISVDDTITAHENLKRQLNAHRTIQAGVTNETKNLNKFSSKAGKAIEALGSKAIEGAEKFASAGFALGMAEKAIKEVYNQAVRLSDRGMLMAMRAINVGAIKLRLSAEEFEKIIQSNMNIVTSLGGGVRGIDRFTDELKFASQGLEFMGKNAAEVGAKNMQALARAGVGPNSKAPGMEGVYRKNIVEMNKQFKLFHAGFGDSIDDFAAYYDTVLQSDEVQQKMNTLDSKGVDLMMQELRTRTENLRVMGMNNQQITEMSKRMEEMYNPRKNNQGERIKQNAMAGNAFNTLTSSASAGDAAILQKHKGLFDQVNQAKMMGDTNTAKNLMATKEGQELAEAMKRANDKQVQDGIKSGNMMQNYAANEFISQAGEMISSWMDMGDASLKKGRSGAPNKVDSPEVAEWKNSVKAMTGEGSAVADAFNKLRSVVDQITSLMSNPFTSAITAFIAGVLAMSSTVRGALMGAIRGMVSAVTGGGAGFVAGIRGLLGGIIGMLKKIPGVGAALAGIEGAWDGLNTSTEDYYKRSGIDSEASHVPQWLKDTGVRTLGVLSDVGAAAGRGVTFGAWDPSKNFADKQQAAAAAPTASATPAPASAPQASAASATPLGNLIAKGESGAAGYNANNKGTQGNRIIAGDKQDFSQMTIGDVMKRQSLPKGDPNRLFAVGKYQMIPGTFKEAVNFLKLDPNTQFTPDVQEQMFQYLIMKKRPKIGDYISGKSNDLNGAMLSASQEWASVADPRTGASYYGGANSASISTAQMSSALQQMRAGGNATTVNTAPVQTAMANVPNGANAAPPVNAANAAVRPGTPGANQDNDAVSELKRQTQILSTIAANTVASQGIDRRGYKQNQESAVASA